MNFQLGDRIRLTKAFLIAPHCYAGALHLARGRVIEVRKADSQPAWEVVLIAWEGSDAELIWILADNLELATSEGEE